MRKSMSALEVLETMNSSYNAMIDEFKEVQNIKEPLLQGLDKLEKWDTIFKDSTNNIEGKYTERLNNIQSSLDNIEKKAITYLDVIDGNDITKQIKDCIKNSSIKTVYIPNGTYYLSEPINIECCKIKGDGINSTHIILKTVDSGFIADKNSNRIEICDMSIYGEGITPNSAINLKDTSHGKLYNLNIHNCNNGVLVSSNVRSFEFNKLHIYGCDIGVNLNGGEINNCNFTQVSTVGNRIGVNCVGSDGDFHLKISFYACQIELNTETGVYININGSYTFDSCYIERNNQSAKKDFMYGGLVCGYKTQYGNFPSLAVTNCYFFENGVKITHRDIYKYTFIGNHFKKPNEYCCFEVHNFEGVWKRLKVINTTIDNSLGEIELGNSDLVTNTDNFDFTDYDEFFSVKANVNRIIDILSDMGKWS